MNTASDYRSGQGDAGHIHVAKQTDASDSTVSWGAILAGAVGAAALSLILLILGTGLGLASVSPWTGDGISSSAFGVSTILWIAFTQIAAAGMGGYLAGRLRTRWLNTDGDEVYFRDTAHGFLAWGVATLLTAGLMTSAISAIVRGGVEAAASGTMVASVSANATSNAEQGDDSFTTNYFVDMLFRTSNAATAAQIMSDTAPSAVPSAAQTMQAELLPGKSTEVGRIFRRNMEAPRLSEPDADYLAELISNRTGLSQQEAKTRVNEVYSRFSEELKSTEVTLKAGVDKARKASSYAALWLFISLLIGAFVASWFATFGGRQRDA